MKTQKSKRILSFLPYKHVVISTSLSLNDVEGLFSNSISPAFDPLLNPLSNSKKFQGEVSNKGFKIRVTDYYRGSLTYVVGNFIPDANGVKIDMFVDPNPLFLIGPLLAAIALCGLVVAIANGNYIMEFGSVVFIIFFGF